MDPKQHDESSDPSATPPYEPHPGDVWSLPRATAPAEVPPVAEDTTAPYGDPTTPSYGMAAPPAWTPPEAGGYPTWTAPPAAPRRRRRIGMIVGAGLAAAVLVGGGVGIGVAATTDGAAGNGTAADTQRPTNQFPGFGFPQGQGDGTDGSGGADSGGGLGGSTGSAPDGSGGSGSGTGTSGSVTSSATDDQSVGVVVIDTVLGYQNAQAAGTGMVISSDGTVLTNNHVVAGATSIKATDMSTGRTYNATVVGTDAGDDVAVIKLTGASGLDTVALDTTTNISAGTAVVAVGNAGGTGSLTAATGTVTATGQSITATDEDGGNAEQLTGLLQTNAAIQAGDSGGPLYDSDGEVIGINTAAATSRSGATQAGYAIPIGNALTIAKQIVAGDEGNGVVIGVPAFLGVSFAQVNGPATIAGVIDGLPAAQAGLAAGDTITAVDGTAVNSSAALSQALAAHQPGDTVSLTWTTADGSTQTADVELVAGPAA